MGIPTRKTVGVTAPKPEDVHTFFSAHLYMDNAIHDGAVAFEVCAHITGINERYVICRDHGFSRLTPAKARELAQLLIQAASDAETGPVPELAFRSFSEERR